jgi:hypothetical protein
MGLQYNKALKTIGVKLNFLIFLVMTLVFFFPVHSVAEDRHGYLGYYPPPSSCLQCHEALLAYNHKGNCWTTCHNPDSSLKLCPPATNYPPDFNFTTVCANYQTNMKEPFSCGDCHVSAGDHTAAHDQTFFPSTDCSQCHDADAPTEHGKYNFSCSTCHNSIYAEVKNAIVSGKNGNPVYCADCHGLIDHLTHENAYLPNEGCTDCHLTDLGRRADIVNEHAKKNIDCSGCHNSSNPVVRAAIDKGIAGNSVLCIDCHREFGNHARIHDQTTFTSTECSTCHLANAVSEHQGHGPHGICCLPCHTNEYPGIISSIYEGMAGQNVPCDECHLFPDNRPPIANCGADKIVSTGVATQFSGSSSYDHDGIIINYEWDFGDSTPRVNGITVSHTYTTAGIYQVNLTVTDNQGAIDNDTSTITVRADQIPVIDKILGVKEPGLVVRLIGTNFGDTQGSSIVHIGKKTFDLSSPSIKRWSDTKIRIRLPSYKCRWFQIQGYKYVKVWVTVDGVDSNKKRIKVHKPDTCP